mgnify:CR=1 FL=1
MTEARKKKIVGLVWSLAQTAKECGHAQGLKIGIAGEGWFNAGVNPDEVILKGAIETEEIMNELLVLLGIREYQEHNYMPDPDAAE